MRREAAVVLLAALSLIPLGNAEVGYRLLETSRTHLAAHAPPLSLAPGADGSTTVGANATSATTTLHAPPKAKTFERILALDPAGELSVSLRLMGMENPGRVKALEIHVAPGNGPGEKQVEVEAGALIQVEGAPLSLGPQDRGRITLIAEAKGKGVSTLALEIRLHSPTATGAVVAYHYTLVLE